MEREKKSAVFHWLVILWGLKWVWHLRVSVYVEDDSVIYCSPGSRRWLEPWPWWGKVSAWGPSPSGRTPSCSWCANTGRSRRPQGGPLVGCTPPPDRQTCRQTLGPNTGGVREGEPPEGQRIKDWWRISGSPAPAPIRLGLQYGLSPTRPHPDPSVTVLQIPQS